MEDKDHLDYIAMKFLFRGHSLCILTLRRYPNISVFKLITKTSQERKFFPRCVIGVEFTRET